MPEKALPKIRVAVLSDIHATASQDFRHESHVHPNAKDDPGRNPFAAIRELIAEEDDVRADLVLCPGDLANRVDGPGMNYAWGEIIEIAKELGAQQLIGSAGNHDVIRHKELNGGTRADSIALLRNLDPKFPDRNHANTDYYFDEDFLVVSREHWRVVTVNSCTRHARPDAARQPPEYTRGFIEEKTLDAIENLLADESRPINILMCHHHPIRWTDLTPDDTSDMVNGDRLLKLLEERDPCGWLVLHGHRHVPALGYAGSTSSGAVRFGAGSLGALLPREGRGGIRNQFYILEFDLAELQSLNLRTGGRFRAWNWNSTHGMVLAGQDADLPGSGGFGFRRTAVDLAAMCKARAAQLGQQSVTWQDLVDSDRSWLYVIPSDLKAMRHVLTRGDNAYVEPIKGAADIDKVSFP